MYHIPGDLVINSGVTLTVEPGVTIEFTANQDTLGGGDFSALSELYVRGTLIADATAGDSIRFISSMGGSAQWGQIKIESGSATLRKVAIRGSQIGVQSLNQLTLENASISAVTTGAILRSNASAIKRSVIRDATIGIDASVGGPAIQECTLVGRGGVGIGIKLGAGAITAVADSTDPRPTLVSRYSAGVEMTGGAIADHIVAFKNTSGIFTQSYTTALTAKYCTVVSNTQVGILLAGTSIQIYMSISTNNGAEGIVYSSIPPCTGSGLDYTDSWSNAGPNYSLGNCSVGPHRDSFNPFFVNPTADNYALSSGAIFKTYGPWGAEIGAYGPGPGAPTPATPMTWGRMKATYR